MNALRLPFPTFERPAVQFSSCVTSSGFPCCLSSATGMPCHHDHDGCAICQNRNLLGEFNTRPSSGGSQNNHSNSIASNVAAHNILSLANRDRTPQQHARHLRVGVVGGVVVNLGARGGGGLQPDVAARPLDRTRATRICRGECIPTHVT